MSHQYGKICMRRVTDPDDPKRCRSPAADGGQCWNEMVGGSTYCPAHGGRENRDQEMNNYLSEQFARRLKIEGGPVDEVKILREHLMILNATIATITSRMVDEASVDANSGAVMDLIMKAEKVTASLNRLAISSGLFLGKPALETWGQKIVLAMHRMVEDKYDGWEDDLTDFSNEVATIIIEAKNDEDDK